MRLGAERAAQISPAHCLVGASKSLSRLRATETSRVTDAQRSGSVRDKPASWCYPEGMTDKVSFGTLVPDPEVRRELHTTKMTTHRWDRDPRMAALGWPPAIYRGRFKFRDAVLYEQFKAKMAREAIAKRDALLKEQISREGPAVA